MIANQAVHELRHQRHAPTLHRQVREVLKPSALYPMRDHFAGDGGMANAERYLTVDEQRAARFCRSGIAVAPGRLGFVSRPITLVIWPRLSFNPLSLPLDRHINPDAGWPSAPFS
ncbi:hypothetical protein BI347_00895 [Chromobacterium sphagni]|uniref:Uncharacterized protein n=1 Tax=Chromobacterium sphagni TaxID=1903179 RepID=A0A1S1WY88_9NEIS|nr:hypothetical protein [Chromobacterium sphagni]OHX12214.1 hypothetical protein BI347_00895 [Chromobacterium sphagni]